MDVCFVIGFVIRVKKCIIMCLCYLVLKIVDRLFCDCIYVGNIMYGNLF